MENVKLLFYGKIIHMEFRFANSLLEIFRISEQSLVISTTPEKTDLKKANIRVLSINQ